MGSWLTAAASDPYQGVSVQRRYGEAEVMRLKFSSDTSATVWCSSSEENWKKTTKKKPWKNLWSQACLERSLIELGQNENMEEDFTCSQMPVDQLLSLGRILGSFKLTLKPLNTLRKDTLLTPHQRIQVHLSGTLLCTQCSLSRKEPNN